MVNHRHTRGLVLDLNSEVCPNSFLDNSKVGEAADVYQSTLVDSWVDTSNVAKCSIIGGDLHSSDLLLSSITYSDITNSKIYDSKIINSKLEGVTSRGGNIVGCTITADCVIGDAVLVGLKITEPKRIGEGYWDREPRSFELNTDVARGVVVTESTNGHAYIGCQRKPMRTWIKGARRFGRVIGWDKDTTDYIASHFEEWLKDNG